jgi:MFS family permease
MSQRSALALVFFTSASVLVLEILAGRLMAPFLGVTIETFTGIIGTILAAIAVGSWFGGRAADRYDPGVLLGPLLIVGGVTALLAPTIVSFFGPELRSAGPVEIVLLAALGFFIPGAILSAVSPAVVKLQLRDLGMTGTIVGKFSAVGTAGALVGTFATGFLLLATLPSRIIVFVVGGALVAIGVLLTARLGRLAGSTTVWLLVAAAGAAGLLALVRGPCTTETTYFCAVVEPDPDRDTGTILWLDTLRHSYIDEDPTHLEFRYARIFADVLDVVPDAGPLNTLSVGGGGMSLPRYVAAVRPGSSATVLELDQTLVDIALEDLDAAPDGPLDVKVGDARLTLAETPTGVYDVVFGDARSRSPAPSWRRCAQSSTTLSSSPRLSISMERRGATSSSWHRIRPSTRRPSTSGCRQGTLDPWPSTPTPRPSIPGTDGS